MKKRESAHIEAPPMSHAVDMTSAVEMLLIKPSQRARVGGCIQPPTDRSWA